MHNAAMQSRQDLLAPALPHAWAELQAEANTSDWLEPEANRLAFADPEFLLRRETRGIRFQLEMLKPDLAQTEANIEHTVVVFGSARFVDMASAQARLQAALQSGMAQDIAQAETGGDGYGIVNQDSAIRNTRHALAGFVKGHALPFIMRAQQGHSIGALRDGHAKGRSYGFGGDVIMRRPDSARGEYMVIGPAQRIHASHDGGMVIGDNPRFEQPNAMLGQALGQMVHVRIPGAARQDFIADHQHRGGWVGHA